ncbi:hypothetical protein F5B17DRAFT_407757 [Nemania serpens]|nr:hypothetical protein F5B17DRAFT_407757 [Nemania serpens]
MGNYGRSKFKEVLALALGWVGSMGAAFQSSVRGHMRVMNAMQCSASPGSMKVGGLRRFMGLQHNYLMGAVDFGLVSIVYWGFICMWNGASEAASTIQ